MDVFTADGIRFSVEITALLEHMAEMLRAWKSDLCSD